MEQKKIDRINELAKLAKERELTDEEKVERAALRQEYVNSVLGDLRNQLNNTYVMDEKGNKTKLTRWRLQNRDFMRAAALLNFF